MALLDLNRAAVRFYEALGPELSPRAFADDGPRQDPLTMNTAHTPRACVVEALRAADPALSGGLAVHLLAHTARYDPAHPTPPPILFDKQSPGAR